MIPAEKSLPRRIALLSAKALAGALLLLILALGGALVWLRGEDAALRLRDLAVKSLAEQGLDLRLARLSGPLPSRLRLDDIEVDDSHGPLFRARSLEVRLRLISLLRGVLEVESLRLDSPEIFRLPQAGPDTEQQTETGGIPVLPVDILLGSLEVEQGLLHEAVLSQAGASAEMPAGAPYGKADGAARSEKTRGEAMQTPEAHPDARAMNAHNADSRAMNAHNADSRNDAAHDSALRFGLSGSARLAGTHLSASLRAFLLEGEQGLRLEADLASALPAPASPPPTSQPPASPPPTSQPPASQAPSSQPPAFGEAGDSAGLTGDRLRLLLQFSNAGDGLLRRLPGLEGQPPVSLSLKGDGPLRDWRGSLDYSLGPEDRADAAPKTGQDEARTAETHALPGNGPKTDMDPSADAQAGAGAKAVKDAQGPEGQPVPGSAALLVSGRAVIGLRCATGSLWRDLVLEPAFNLHLENSLRGGGATPASLAPLLAEPLPLTLNASANQGRFHADLKIEVLDLLAEARADFGSDTGALKAEARIKAPDKGRWQALAASVLSDEHTPGQSPAMGGEFLAEAALTFSGPSFTGPSGEETQGAYAPGNSGSGAEASAFGAKGAHSGDLFGKDARSGGFAEQGGFAGNLRLTGSSLRWPSRELADVMGDSAMLRLTFSGPASGPYRLSLDQCLIGLFSAQGKAVIGPKQGGGPSPARATVSGQTSVPEQALGQSPIPAPEAPSVPVSEQASAQTSMPDHAPPSGQTRAQTATQVTVPAQAPELASGPPPAPAPETAETALEADFTVTVKDLSPLTGGSLEGELDLRLTASGTTRKPALVLTAQGRDLLWPGNGRIAPVMKATADLELLGENVQGTGALDFSLPDSPGGPLTLTAAWRADAVAGQAPALTLENLNVRGAGLEMRGSLRALLPAEAAPALQGSFSADLRDWRPLAALTGAPLQGLPARLDLNLEHGASQSARLSLSLPSLTIPGAAQGEAPALKLESLSLRASAGDLFGSLSLDANLESGPGRAAFLRWHTGRGSLRGSSGRGDFSLALEQKSGRAGKKAAVLKKSQPAKGPGGLHLAGGYALAPDSEPFLRLDALSLREPRSQSGLELKKPLRISLADGLAFTGAVLAFEPTGSLTADAALTASDMRLKADLKNLSLAFFKLFGLSGLPGGDVSATADLRAAGNTAQGGFTLHTRLNAGKPDTGGQRGRAPSGKTPEALPPVFALELSGRLAPSGSGALLTGDGRFGGVEQSGQDKQGSLSFRLPLRGTGNGPPLPDAEAPLQAALAWNGPAEKLWQVVPLPDTYLSGPLMLDAAVSGRLNAPKVRVRGYMAGGRFEDVGSGLLISGINLEADNQDNGDIRLLLEAGDGAKGKLAAEATLKGFEGGAPVVRFRSQLDGFSPLHRDDLSIRLSGFCGVEGPLDTVAVSGLIRVDEGEFIISGRQGGSVPLLDVERKARNGERASSFAASGAQRKESAPDTDADAAAESGEDADTGSAVLGPALDMRLVVPRNFHIRGMGLDSEWRGDLKISGHATSPGLRGSLTPVRGTMDILARTFRFSGGDIRFDGNADPVLNLELTFENQDIEALVRVGGSASNPGFELSSTPPLPQDEILSRVLFGKNATNLSRFEAIQLANSMRQLSGGGGDLLTGIRRRTGLDVLRLGDTQNSSRRGSSGMSGEGDLETQNSADGGEASVPALEAGRYITDNIFVGVEQGVDQESTAVRVEIELFPRVTVQGRSGANAGEAGIGWKMDY